MNINKAYASKTPAAAFPTLQKHAQIPHNLRSELASQLAKTDSVVGLGVVNAICRALTSQPIVQTGTNVIQFTYLTSDDVDLPCICRNQNGARTWYSDDPNDMMLPYLAVLAEAMYFGLHHIEIKQKYENLFLALFKDTNGQMTEQDILKVSSQPIHQDNMKSLVDALYFNLKNSMGDVVEEPLSNLNTQILWVDRQDFWMVKPKPVTKQPTQIPTPTSRIERLVMNGAAILLTGPTGTFKTETAKRASIATGRSLVVIKGTPGLEDRDLIGGITPTIDGPQWVDGPLTRAFRMAQTSSVSLIVDELLRFEAYYQALFVGALDEYAPDELQAMGITPTTDERHRMLTLFNGETVVAPVSQLAIIATTNLGDEYVQTSAKFDAALLGRFKAIIDFEYADETIAKQLYEQFANKAAANAALQVEKYTRANTVQKDGVYQRELNPRVVMNWLDEYTKCVNSGMPAQKAFLEAAQITVIPFCVGRDSFGQLNKIDVASLSDEIKKYAASV